MAAFPLHFFNEGFEIAEAFKPFFKSIQLFIAVHKSFSEDFG